jgi:hypothetical protein
MKNMKKIGKKKNEEKRRNNGNGEDREGKEETIN